MKKGIFSGRDGTIIDESAHTGNNSEELEQSVLNAARIIKKGGVAAIPTETVYGLAADAFNPEAVARIFEIKGRPAFDPLIVHVTDMKQAALLVQSMPDPARRLAEAFWPGPLTLVLPKKTSVPDIVTSGLPTVAVRCPDHPVALSIIKHAGTPLAAPSANRFGKTSPTTAAHVRTELGEAVDAIVEAPACSVGVESTIISLIQPNKPRLLRPGGLPIEDISKIIGDVDTSKRTSEGKPIAPGMLSRHYAPATPVLLEDEADKESLKGKKVGLLCFGERRVEAKNIYKAVNLSPKGDLREAAANLFRAIRELDSADIDVILAQPVPEKGLGSAIMDRLRRASQRIL